MHISFLSVSDQLGGSEIALLDMIAGIGRLRPDWKIHLILPGRGPLLERAEASGADCVILPLPKALARLGEFSGVSAGWSLRARLSFAARLAPVAAGLPGYLRKLRRVVRAQHPSILHTNGIKAHMLGARLRGDLKLIWHMHEYVGERRLTRVLLRALERRASVIVANSASVASDVEESLAPAVPLHVVRNAVDLRTFTPEGPAEDLDERSGLRAPDGPVVRVGLVGTFARWKGHEVFLRAIAALPQDVPVRGYVIGEPVYATNGSQHTSEELRALAKTLGVTKRIGFTGFLGAAPAMRALDIVVHPSTRPEPFGLVIAEAMACGRAVITSGAGGAAELIQPEHNAIVHAPGDAAKLAQAIRRLASDSALRRDLGIRARASACERFDRDRLASELVDIYERMA
jgi:glycosyltransferase involved in cell wall biosynthesis